MFFTLLSKTVLKNEGNSRVYFYLFLAGIVCYIILHYYLNSGERNAILQKLNNYFYYIVPLDFAIGAWLLKTSEIKSKKSDEDEDDNSTKYTDEQRLKIMKNLEDSKTMKRQHDEEVKKNSSPFLKKDIKSKQDYAKLEQEQHLLQQQMMMEQEEKKRMLEQVQAQNTSESPKPKQSSKKSPKIYQSDAATKVLVKGSSKHKEDEDKQIDTDLPIYEGK